MRVVRLYILVFAMFAGFRLGKGFQRQELSCERTGAASLIWNDLQEIGSNKHLSRKGDDDDAK